MNLKNKRVLVTGGAGFIGSHLVDRLISQGAVVSIVDNLSTGHQNNLNPDAKFYLLDINSPEVEKVFLKERPEVIYSLAFNTIVPKAVVDPIFDIQSLNGNLSIMVRAVKHGAEKIILASSGFVYGNTKVLPTPETEKVIPENPYIITKSASENYLHFFNKVYGLKFVILRYATVYGPRQVGGAMADYVRSISSDRRAVFYGDGQKTRDYVYIDDVIAANLRALDFNADQDITPIFNIGTGREVSLNYLHSAIAKLLHKDYQPDYQPERPGELQRFCLDSSKAKKYLHWEPTINLEQGLELMLADKFGAL